jgi:heavy metal sensor kinase
MSSAKIGNSGAFGFRRRSLTIRTRLMLWSASMIVVVYAILAAVVFWGLTRLVQAEVDALLEGQSQELIARVHEHHDNLDEAELEIREELGRRIRRDFLFRVLAANGEQLLTSEIGYNLPDIAKGATPSEGFVTLGAQKGYPPVRVYRQRVRVGDRPVWAEITYSLEQVNSNLWHYARLFLGSLPLVVLLAGIGGSVIARRSLRPVAGIIAAARRIEGDPSGKRIETRNTGDELDQLAETLNRMLDRIERHVEQITQFTADASHELRSPLTALRGAAEVALTKRSSAEELRRVLENAVDQYDRLTRIAEDLLLLARIDAHQTVIHFQPVLVRDLLQNTIELYGPIAESRHVDLTCCAVSDSVVEGDAGRLMQLIGNLVDNAVKSTPAGGRVDLAVWEESDSVLISVKDTGTGIAAHHLPLLFDRFYRTDDNRDRSTDRGAGLGLSICKAICTLHSGDITLTSREGHGTEVTVRLPVSSKMNELSSLG